MLLYPCVSNCTFASLTIQTLPFACLFLFPSRYSSRGNPFKMFYDSLKSLLLIHINTMPGVKCWFPKINWAVAHTFVPASKRTKVSANSHLLLANKCNLTRHSHNSAMLFYQTKTTLSTLFLNFFNKFCKQKKCRNSTLNQ